MGQSQTKLLKFKSKTNPKFDCREEYFIKNGGILLEKQIALSQGRDIGAGQLKVFSNKDIIKATSNYDTDLIVGSSNLRTVYKGTLEDRTVAIRVPPQVELNPNLIDNHLTEASMTMQMNHGNIEKLIGCCLETVIPILVHEFVPNGSLFRHLHGDPASNNEHLQWDDRLKIASDTAYALSYMHNALPKPVVHRHLNSHIILVDHSFHAKLTNFGFSVIITPGETPQTWPTEGVPGYIDPEYILTQIVTDKCDVYSFGVLLLELLTRRQPVMMAIGGTDLVDAFVSAMERNSMMKMIDSEVLEQLAGNNAIRQVQQVVQLALRCVTGKGTERPTMIEVVDQLLQIRGQDNK